MEPVPGLRLSVLFAESLSLCEIQSRARTRAVGGARLRLHPAHVDTGANARALTPTRARDLQRMDTRSQCTHAIDPRFYAYVNSLPDVDRRAQGTQLRGESLAN